MNKKTIQILIIASVVLILIGAYTLYQTNNNVKGTYISNLNTKIIILDQNECIISNNNQNVKCTYKLSNDDIILYVQDKPFIAKYSANKITIALRGKNEIFLKQ